MTSTSQLPPPPAYSPDTCMFCHQSLCITAGADPDSESEHPLERGEPATITDDVELYCGPPGSGPSGHHAHWTCLIDHAMQARSRGVVPVPVASTPHTPASTTCAVCNQNVLDPSGRFVVDVRNEGGETKRFDFGAIITVRIAHGLGWHRPLARKQEEELFLGSNPDQVHNRAFHDLVAQGDYAGAIELVTEHGVDVNCTYGNDGLTALQKAVFSGDTSGAEFLRGLGATM